MYRKFLTICLLPLLLLFPACKAENRINYLSHQTYPYHTQGVLTYDGTEYEVLVSARQAGDILLQILRPDVLAGAVFELREGEVIVSCGTLTENWEDGGYAAEEGILLASRIFSLSESDYSGAGVKQENGVSYSYATFRVEGGTVSVYRQEGLSEPSHITAELNEHTLSFRYMNES